MWALSANMRLDLDFAKTQMSLAEVQVTLFVVRCCVGVIDMHLGNKLKEKMPSGRWLLIEICRTPWNTGEWSELLVHWIAASAFDGTGGDEWQHLWLRSQWRKVTDSSVQTSLTGQTASQEKNWNGFCFFCFFFLLNCSSWGSRFFFALSALGRLRSLRDSFVTLVHNVWN